MALTSTQIDYMLSALLTKPGVLQVAAIKIEPGLFDPVTETLRRVFWELSRSHWLKFGTTITELTLLMQWSALMGIPQVPAEVATYSRLMYLASDSVQDAEALKIVESFLWERKGTQKVESLRFAEPDKVSQVLTELSTTFESTRLSSPTDMQLSLDFNQERERIVRLKTYTNFIDEVSGDIFERSLIGLIGPPGGGKSTIIRQIGCSMAKTQQRVHILSYEEPVNQFMEYKILSCLAGIPITHLESISRLSDLPKEDQEKIRKFAAPAQPFLGLSDMTTKANGPFDIESILIRHKEEGKLAKLYMVDWMGLAANLWMTTLNINVDSGKKYHYYNLFCHEMKRLIDKYGVTILLAHQLQGQEAKRSKSTKSHKQQDAEGSTGFSHLMSLCFTLSVMDEKNQIATFSSAKNRHRKASSVKIRMVPGCCKFDLVDEFSSGIRSTTTAAPVAAASPRGGGL